MLAVLQADNVRRVMDRVLERELGYRIRLAREAQNFGLRRFATDAKIDISVLSKVENGETLYPRQDFLKKAADRLRVPVEWLTYGAVPQRVVLDLPRRDNAIQAANRAGTLPREVELTLTLSPAYNVQAPAGVRESASPFGNRDATWWADEIAWLTFVLGEIEAGRKRPTRRMGLTNRNPDPEPNAPASSAPARAGKKPRAA